jgi:hypothetical protein
MRNYDTIRWLPISKMPMIAGMISAALDITRDHLDTLAEARTDLQVLDDATLDRAERVHTGQLEFVVIYARQIARWRTENPPVGQIRELDRMEEQNRQLLALTEAVLASVLELRKARVLTKRGVELGLKVLPGGRPPTRH